MSELQRLNLIASLALKALGFAAIIVGAAALIRYTAAEGEDAPYVENVDARISAGAQPWALDPDDPLLARRAIVITREINERSSEEIIAKLLHLDAISTEPIDLYLRTSGGWYADAFAIIDVMGAIRAPVHVHAIGLCQSAGALILLAATGERIAYEMTDISPHFNIVEECEDPSCVDNLTRERILRLWNQRARIPKSWRPLARDEERFLHLSAAQALEYAIVDRVVPTLSRLPQLPPAAAAPATP